MAFQDFGHLTERRKAENQKKLRKRIAIGAISFVFLLILISAGVFAVVNHVPEKSTKTGEPAPSSKPTENIPQSVKAIKMVCASTDYKETCINSLSKVSNSSMSQPKDLIKAAIEVTSSEIQKAFDSISDFKFETKEEKDAFEDCKELIANAKEELKDSISNVGISRTNDLNNWLSAVMSYQATCIDGFPEGKLKTQMEKTLKSGKELTSNALAILSEVSSILSTFQISGTSRRLLEDGEQYPSWMTHEDRRILKGQAKKEKPNVVVAKDGSGQFKTINDALAALPKTYSGRYIIYVKQGIYDETVIVTKKMENITMYGDGSQKTIVTGSKNFVDGVRTFQTATFAALGDGFIAKAMGFRNTAGPEKHQAVAVRVQSDRSIFLNCRFEGYQDTLYAQTHRQFYRSCVISGTVDFIFGDAASIFQNCLIIVRKPLDNQQCIVTAQGRTDKRETTGIVLQNCRITADPSLGSAPNVKIRSYLGRPWKEFSRTIVMESTIGGFIHPDGWLPWEGEFALKTLYYAEFGNKGPGAALNARVKWPGYKKGIKRDEAMKYTVGPFLQGDWIKASGTTVHMGLFA